MFLIRYKHLLSFVILSTLMLGAVSCHKGAHVSRTEALPSKFDTLLVIPFKDMMNIYGENVTVRSPLSGKTFTTGYVAEGAAAFLTEELIALLKRRNDVRLISPDLIQGVWAQLLLESQKEMPELKMIVETGLDLKADAVLVGYIFRFKDRKGTQYSVDLPASVAFDVELISVADRTIIWSRRFNETQQALTEDLFQFGKFLKRKGRWITARDMAVTGLEELFQTFPVP